MNSYASVSQALARRMGLSVTVLEAAAGRLLDLLLGDPTAGPADDAAEAAESVLQRLARDGGLADGEPVDLPRRERLIAQIARTPGCLVADLELVAGEEAAALLASGQGPRPDYPRSRRIEQIVADHAQARPEQAAIVHGASTTSYAQLVERATGLARALAAQAVGEGDRVAILLPRSAAQVTGALGTLYAGATYVPVDPELPADRVAFLLEDSGARAIVCAASAAPPVHPAAVLRVDARGHVLPGAGPAAPACPRPAGDATSPAYVMYTSGTTGRPKGVPVPHRGVARLVVGCDYVRLDACTVMLNAGAVGFDASIFETWGALLNGGTLCIADRETLLDTAAFAELLRTRRVDTALLTPALFALHAEREPSAFQPMRQLILGGDRFPVSLARCVAQACPTLTLINAYGPTENAVISVAGRVDALEEDGVPLGRPIANSSAFVMNRHGRLLPAGCIGELWVGGDGLGPGYVARPDLDARLFRAHAYAPRERLYRTGDLVSLDEHGRLWFHGRCDHQVKIRGQRIELGEVEAALGRQAGVTNAVAVACGRGVGDSSLHAFCTASGPVDGDDLRRALALELPAAAVPASVDVLEALPVTANGKVDRAQLVRLAAQRLESAPRGPSDPAHVFGALVGECLGLPVADLGQPFVALGGSSLGAVRLARLIEARFDVRCTTADVLGARSLTELRDSLAAPTRARAAGVPAGTPVPADCLASPQQAAFFVEQAKAPASTAYNLPLVIELAAMPDLAALRRSLEALAERHPILRARFAQAGDGVRMGIAPRLETVPLAVSASPDALADLVRPFDLGAAPCWRVVLLEGSRPRLLFDIHHILCDGHALELLLREWDGLYHGRADLPVPAHAFHDWLAWRATPPVRDALASQLEQARAQLAPLPAAPALPVDRQRQGPRGWRGRHHVGELGAGRAAAVEAAARHARVTPFHVLLGAYALWFSRTTGSADFVVGVPALGRDAAGADVIVGPLVNTVAVRLRIDEDTTPERHLQAVAAAALRAMGTQDAPVADLVRALAPTPDPRRHPLFDSMFAFQDGGLDGLDVLGGRVRWLPEATRATLFDLNVQVEPAGGDFRITWAASADLFEAATLRFLSQDFLHTLDELLAMPRDGTALLRPRPRKAIALPTLDFAF